MAARIPGLVHLRTFEVAARHLSFTRAAEELGVTPAAVSHAIREAESQLQVRLFDRSSRVVRLTRAGEMLAGTVSEAFDGIGRTVARLRSMDGRPRLVVTSAPSFAAKWLVPRLDRFTQTMQGADVRIDVSSRMVDFYREDVDVGIRYGTGNYRGLHSERLFQDTIFPVCSPKLLTGPRPLRQPRDLRHHTLIHVEWEAQGETWPNWSAWVHAAGAPDVDTTRGVHLSDTTVAIQAAIDGQGIALGSSTLVADDLAAGRLVCPFEVHLKTPSQFAYYLVIPKAAREQPLVQRFRAWILGEAAPLA